MRLSAIRLLIYVLLFSFLFTACAGTKLTDTWVDKAHKGNQLSNILVIGFTFEGNEEVRQKFENSFVKQLIAAGIEAESSMDTIPSPPDMELKKDEILDAVKKFNSDGVIITHLVGKDTKHTVTYQHSIHSSSDLFFFYRSAYDRRGYSRSSETVYLETNLYDVKTEKLIWSGQSKTFKPDSYNQMFNDLVSKVIEDLKKNNLIPQK